MTRRDDKWLAEIVHRLARLRSVPSGVLAEVVARDGACMEVSADDRPPRWLYENGTDRELAARLCRGCPVQRECLELELRMFGAKPSVSGARWARTTAGRCPAVATAAARAAAGDRQQPDRIVDGGEQ